MREHWSKIGFILASIGSAIGLGNIWRFPYIVGQSGGGAFLIPYFIAVLFFGIPVMLLEFSVGRKFKTSIITSFKKINSKFKYLAFIPIITSTGILGYYIVVAGWTLIYSIFSFTGYPEFSQFSNQSFSLIAFLVVLIISAIIVKKGIKHGIEKTCEYLLPFLFLFMIILLIKAISLPNALEGIKFYLKPDLSMLSNFRIWLLAFGQAFFSLSVGFGVMLTYGSYTSKKENLIKSSLWIAGADTFIAILAGFIIFPIVFSFGFNPATGPELAFVTLPAIFSTMAFGYIFGFLFFALLFIGALTSSISMLELGVTSMIDKFKLTRKKATIILSSIVALIGLPSALSYSGFNLTLFGKPFLDSMDFIFGTVMTPISALTICLFIAWFWKVKEILKQINKNSKLKISHFIIPLTKYIVPLILLIILLADIFSKF